MQTLTPETPAVSPSPDITASFMWDRAEHRRLVGQITRHMKRGWLARFGWVAVAAIGLASVAVNGMMGEWEGAWWTLVPAGYLLLISLLARFVSPWFAARRYPLQHPCVTSPFSVTLTGEGVRTVCNHSDVLVKWDGVRRAVETPEFLLFYVSDRCAQYLPKRALDGAGELKRARELVLRHAPLHDATKR